MTLDHVTIRSTPDRPFVERKAEVITPGGGSFVVSWIEYLTPESRRDAAMTSPGGEDA